MSYNKKTFKEQNKYNAKANGELHQPKHNKVNRNSYRYNDDFEEAQEVLNSYIGNFRF